MKVSTKGRYGLRVLADLAVHQGEGPIPVNILAQRQALSPLYLEQVFSALKKAGLVRSVKGPRGGYMLGASPSALTLGDILRVLEGGLAVVDDSGLGAGDPALARCLKTQVWDVLNQAVSRLADETTLADLAADYKKSRAPADGDYSI